MQTASKLTGNQSLQQLALSPLAKARQERQAAQFKHTEDRTIPVAVVIFEA